LILQFTSPLEKEGMDCNAFKSFYQLLIFFRPKYNSVTGTRIRCLVVDFFQLQIEREVNQKGIVVKRQRLI